jgi:hypothetical protein
VEKCFVDLRVAVGLGLGLLGIICAAVGIFVVNGISIEFPGIMLGDWATTSV